MDFTSKTKAWVGSVSQTFVYFCTEVETILSQESLENIEDTLLTAGTNVKQFCSEMVQDVLPQFIVDSQKEEAHDLSASIVEPADELHIDSSEQNADVGMPEKSNVGVNENEVDEKLFQEVADPTKEDLSMTSICCAVNPSNDEERCNAQADLSTSIFVKFGEFMPSMKAGKPGDLMDANANSNALPSVDPVIFTKSDTSAADGGIDASAANANVALTKSSFSGFELDDEFEELERFSCVADFERSGDAISAELREDHFIKPAMEVATQAFSKLKMNESRIVVGRNERDSTSDLEAKSQSYQENIQEILASKMNVKNAQEYEQQPTCSEDVRAESDQPMGEHFTMSLSTLKTEALDHDVCVSTEALDHDVCEPDWVIV